MTVNEFPAALDKKMKLLSYFKRYMTEHLVKAGAGAVIAEGDSISRLPHLHTWFRTMCAIVMHLTNGTVQVVLYSLLSIKCMGGANFNLFTILFPVELL